MKAKILDGAMGTILLDMGFTPPFEQLNITHPHIIKKIHQDYIDAGSEVLLTHTFAAKTVQEVEAAWNNIKELPAMKLTSIGPLANTPLLVDFFKDKTRIVFETIYDLKTAKDLIESYHHLDPIFSFCLKTSDFEKILDELAKYKITTIGLNCLNGFEEAETLLCLIPPKYEIYFKPNAGNKEIGPDDFANNLKELNSKFNITYLGGCCATTPSHILKVRRTFRDL